MSLRSIILVMVAPVLGPLFNLILCLIDCLLLFSFSFAVFFCCFISFIIFHTSNDFMSEFVMKKYVASYEDKCKKKSGQEYWDNIDFIYCFTTLN